MFETPTEHKYITIKRLHIPKEVLVSTLPYPIYDKEALVKSKLKKEIIDETK